jgi:hypothetical protein
MLVSFFSALFLQDWMVAETEAALKVYDFLAPFY